jgi:lipopolysaccharide/colanic/teichoic acid biosynthesis glycosyltransferase
MPAELSRAEASATIPGRHNGLPRAVEAGVALFALLAAAPVIAGAALAIALSSGGPVFFRQKRVGQHGRLFDLYKLRTMRPSADGPQVTSSNDQRITRLGRFLRRTKLDELPTLWNVLNGEMGLVGPRPEVPRYVRLDDPAWQTVLTVPPGLTDPVTLKLRNEEELLASLTSDTESYYVEKLLPLKLAGYIAYLEDRDWRSDIKILILTAVEIVRGSISEAS